MKRILMHRPTWNLGELFRARAKYYDITVLICQYNTLGLSKLCVESLLRFYPDLPVLIADTDSDDGSELYAMWLQVVHPNIRCWINKGIKSHGLTMHQAICNYVTTKYVLLLDSDVIIERGGWLEAMLDQFRLDPQLLSTGSYMEGSYKADACALPEGPDDILPYNHPSCSIFDLTKYHILPPFADHGAPCVFTMKAGIAKGFHVGYYPVDEYVSHLSGASWGTCRSTWEYDHGVTTKPFVTFVLNPGQEVPSIALQEDMDFDVVYTKHKTSETNIFVWLSFEPKTIDNNTWAIRWNVRGEYVCSPIGPITPQFVKRLKWDAISFKRPDKIDVDGQHCYKRSYWQAHIAFE